MHELSLAEAMLDIIKEQAELERFNKVTSVILEIGALSHVEADAMLFCFDAVVEGSLAEGAILKIEHTSAKGQCSDCHKINTIENVYEACPYCGAFGLKILEGDEIRILKLEVE